ncbi:MAG: hypothetical protein WD270_05400 [Acetobacterales bacterium]
MKYFDPIVVAMTSLYSISTMRNAQLNGHASGVSSGQKAVIYGKSLSNIQIELELTQILDPISRNEWPEKIELFKLPLNEPKKDPNTMQTGRMGITWAIFSHAYLTYFESIKDTITRQHGSNWNTWTIEELKFAYQIRNACAHSGKVHFANPNATGVTWKGATYQPSDNGRKIFDDLSVVEILLLMEEVEDAL